MDSPDSLSPSSLAPDLEVSPFLSLPPAAASLISPSSPPPPQSGNPAYSPPPEVLSDNHPLAITALPQRPPLTGIAAMFTL
ncbi:Os06g0350400 [Oryza sativa Japonica Group]|uniref:Os06g0350400 protein n=1 Tax=Oryza sativa subsp. japonica TaxID=39947 RepID=A0A0P0WWJ6_ORYSJ|nr:Os06g0350400 [Oryza sativa Japonica Group]